MIPAFTIGETTPNQQQDASIPEVKMGTIGMDFSKLTTGEAIPVFNSDTTQSKPTEKQKRKRVAASSGGTVITDSFDSKSSRELSMIESKESYENKYTETNNMLRSAIAQIDTCLTEVHDDIADIRSSKTMRSKYTYLSNLQGAMGGLISNKIAAARELNSTITKCNELELRRYKEVQSANLANEQDENKRLQEMYKAFVSTPVGNGMSFSSALGPSTAEMTVPSTRIVGDMIGSADAQFADYMSNLSPAQNMMLLESNPNIKQVVVYNQETGARYFDVIDMSTGESVPNVDKHDAVFLEDVTIDLKNKIASNTNLGETYPLIIVGQPIMTEY